MYFDLYNCFHLLPQNGLYLYMVCRKNVEGTSKNSGGGKSMLSSPVFGYIQYITFSSLSSRLAKKLLINSSFNPWLTMRISLIQVISHNY